MKCDIQIFVRDVCAARRICTLNKAWSINCMFTSSFSYSQGHASSRSLHCTAPSLSSSPPRRRVTSGIPSGVPLHTPNPSVPTGPVPPFHHPSDKCTIAHWPLSCASTPYSLKPHVTTPPECKHLHINLLCLQPGIFNLDFKTPSRSRPASRRLNISRRST